MILGAMGATLTVGLAETRPKPIERPSTNPNPRRPTGKGAGEPEVHPEDTGGTRGDKFWYELINRWFHSLFGS